MVNGFRCLLEILNVLYSNLDQRDGFGWLMVLGLYLKIFSFFFGKGFFTFFNMRKAFKVLCTV